MSLAKYGILFLSGVPLKTRVTQYIHVSRDIANISKCTPQTNGQQWFRGPRKLSLITKSHRWRRRISFILRNCQSLLLIWIKTPKGIIWCLQKSTNTLYERGIPVSRSSIQWMLPVKKLNKWTFSSLAEESRTSMWYSTEPCIHW